MEDRHPSKFFADIVNSFQSVDNCIVLPAEAQRCLLYMLQGFGMLQDEPHRKSAASCDLPPADIHLNPADPVGHGSSSYNTQLGKHVAPAGGFGAPLSVNGAFYHSHDDPDFKTIHPNADLSTYAAMTQKAVKSERGRKSSKKPTSLTPSSNSLERVATPPGSDATVADEEPYAGPLIKAEEPEDSAVVATYSLLEHGLEDETAERDIALTSIDAHDDSGIVIGEPSKSDTQLTNNAVVARKSMDSQSGDSGYNSQSQDQSGHDAPHAFGPASAGSSHSDVKADIIADEQSQSAEQLRKKLTPTVGFPPRRTSSVRSVVTETTAESSSAASVSTPTKPTTSLGKHSRKDLEDTVYETTAAAEPEAKRSKDSQD